MKCEKCLHNKLCSYYEINDKFTKKMNCMFFEDKIISSDKEKIKTAIYKPKDEILCCPICGHILGQGETQIKFIYANKRNEYCCECGQHVGYDEIKSQIDDYYDRYSIEDLMEIDYYG